MKNVFYEVGSLDKRCYEDYFLSEDVLMEHAALAMANFIYQNFEKNVSILIVCGKGNNGADGIALARLLHSDFNICLYLADVPSTRIGQLQLKRAKSVGVQTTDVLTDCVVIVDALFGSGLSKTLDSKYQNIIDTLNTFSGYKIACDIPSGLGQTQKPFRADTTITMGGYKTILFEDFSKDNVGEIVVASLGINAQKYEMQSNVQLLERKDLRLPIRHMQATHKGNFGHLCVVVGTKKGAGMLSALAGFNFGAGLVTALMHEEKEISPMIMSSHFIPSNTTALAVGMGLGSDYDNEEIKKILLYTVPKVLDADLFYSTMIVNVLEMACVLTPHPKEFVSLLKITDLADINVETLLRDRFFYVTLFCQKYINVVLVLKGSNTLIGSANMVYINPFSSPSLSKGGSGDVLSGIIGALLAQNYTLVDAAISGSLALSFASMKYDKNNYSMTPLDLIENLKDI